MVNNILKNFMYMYFALDRPMIKKFQDYFFEQDWTFMQRVPSYTWVGEQYHIQQFRTGLSRISL